MATARPPQLAPPPILVADHPALDFMNSRASPGGVAMEWLTDPAALEAWMAAAGLRHEAPPGSRLQPMALERVLRLREWLRGFVARHAGRPLQDVTDSELTLLNEELAADDSYRRLSVVEGRIGWSPSTYRSADEAVVQPLARAIGHLISDGDFARVRKCESDDCSLWFLDRTKAGSRRWCSMAVCGNRAKARAHRARG